MTDENDLDDQVLDPAAEALWTAEIERRAREIAAGEVELIDAEKVHVEVTSRLRARKKRTTTKE